MDVPSWISRAPTLDPEQIDNRARVRRMSVGPGAGEYCAYCHKRIEAKAIEYEVDAYVAAGWRTLHFHRICLHLWEGLVSQGAPNVATDGRIGVEPAAPRR